jgi:hypothetical protein
MFADRVAVDGKACRVRPTVGHFDQHRRKQGAQACLEVLVLQIKADDTAHGRILYMQAQKQKATLTAAPGQINCRENQVHDGKQKYLRRQLWHLAWAFPSWCYPFKITRAL